MKKLYLLRHAEAEDFSTSGDFERPLSKNGQKQASQVGAYIAEHNIVFDKVLCSSSRRTCETLSLLNIPLENVEKSSLFYNASDDKIRELLQATEEAVQSLLYIGHNPGIAFMAYELSELPSIELSRPYAPATFCGYQFDITKWSDLRWKQGKMINFYQPNKINPLYMIS